MAKALRVEAGCDLMLQPLPEKTLSDAKDFRVVYDDESNPAIFGLGYDGKLVLIAKDPHGNNTLVDLKKQLGLAAEELVSAMGIRQDPDTKNIYLAFGTKTGDAGKVYVVAPFVPKTSGKEKPWYESLDKSYLLNGSDASGHVAHNFMFGTIATPSNQRDSEAADKKETPDVQFPFLAVVRSDPPESRQDTFRVEVDLAKKTWTWAKDFTYPFHFNSMQDYCAGTVPGSSGVFGLNITQSKPQLTYVGQIGAGPDPNSPLMVNLPLPEKPQCVATALDRDGFTNLFVGGEKGIFHISGQEATVSDKIGTIREPVLKHRLLYGLSQLHVAQKHGDPEDRSIVIWALNRDGNVVYQPAEFVFDAEEGYDTVRATREAVGLLSLDSLTKRTGSKTAKKVKIFNALIHPVTGAQQIYVLTDDGAVSWLQQEPRFGLWTEEQFRIPDADEVNDISTYTCHVSIVDEKGKPQPNTEIFVTTSSHTRATVNGRAFHFSPEPRNLTTDANGTLTIILPANDLKAPKIDITGQDLTPYSLVPADKATEKLSSAATNGSLKDAKTPNGGKVFPNINADNENLLKELDGALKSKAAAGSSATHKRMGPLHRGLLDNVKNLTWEAWHGIQQGVEKAVNIVVDAAKIAIKTVANAIEKTWEFVISAVEHVLQAISSILEWIADKIEDALVWLASKITWTNVLDIKNIFNEVILTIIDLGSHFASHGKEIVDDFFDDIERNIDSLKIPPEPSGNFGKAVKPPTDEKKVDHSNNPCFNWATYHVEHGGVKSGTNGVTGAGEDGMIKLLGDSFNNLILPIWNSIQKDFGDIFKELEAAFTSNKTFVDVLRNVGLTLVKTLVKALRAAITAMLEVFVKMFAWMKDILKKPLNIWLLTKLYRKITPDHEQLDMLNLFSMLLAVPTSWIFKLTTGKNPSEVPQIKQFLEDVKRKKWDSLPVTQPSNVRARRAAGAPEKKEDLIERLLKNTPEPNRTKWKEGYHMCFMVLNTGKATYTLFDMAKTAFEWRPKSNEDPSKWELTWKFWKTLFEAGTSFPVTKIGASSGRPALARQLRLWAWCITTPLNLIKSGVKSHGKPALAGLAGIFDMGFYTAAVCTEGSTSGSPEDSLMEITNRLQSCAWALTSACNAQSRASNQAGLAVAGILYVTYNAQNFYIVAEQWKYWEKHDSSGDKAWNPPVLATALHGSM